MPPTAAFTFDDGPDPRNTPRLLAVLRRMRVRAVFCLVGEQARRHPALVRRIAADGHVLCNHSRAHDDLGTWSPPAIQADLLAADAAIRAAVPGARIPFFRAPYGSWGVSTSVAARLGMRPLGWRLAIGDWAPPGADVLVARLMSGITAGAVVLLHDGGGDRTQTVDAVAEAIPRLRADGWRLAVPA